MAGISNPCALLQNMITQTPDEAMNNHCKTLKQDLRKEPMEADIHPYLKGGYHLPTIPSLHKMLGALVQTKAANDEISNQRHFVVMHVERDRANVGEIMEQLDATLKEEERELKTGRTQYEVLLDWVKIREAPQGEFALQVKVARIATHPGDPYW